MNSRRAPNERPSRPLSAYNFFFRKERERLLEQNPTLVKTLGFKGMAKHLAKQWKGIDKQSRDRYNSLASHDKIRYSQELAEFQSEQEEFLARLDAEERASDGAFASEDEEKEKEAHVPPSTSKHPQEQQQAALVLPRAPTSIDASHLYRFLHNPRNVDPTRRLLTFPTPGSSTSTNGMVASSAQRVSPFVESQASKPVSFDHEQSLKNMARKLGNEGIDFLLAVLQP